MKKFLLMALLFISAVPVLAQEREETGHPTAPYNFIGLQGGVQNTFNNEFNNWKTFTPTASFSIGRWFTPVIGARLHLNGAWSKSGVNYLLADDGHYNYNYVTPTADVLVNLCTLFGKKDWYPVNLIFVGGLGANYAFENYYRSEEKALGSTMLYADNDNRWAFNGKVGLMLDIPICKWLSFNLEGDLNARYVGKSAVFNDDILQFVGQAGLTFKFGYKKAKPAPEPVVAEVEPVYSTRIDTIWYDDVQYKDKFDGQKTEWKVYYDLRGSDFPEAAKELKEACDFAKKYEGVKMNVVGYADKGTGNPKINMEYSKLRAEKAVKALKDAGIDGSLISMDYKGDTVQPFADNDKNRVVIITAQGTEKTKEKVVTKKFRTKEVRERVN
ncbi:MAG: OmpA family protein [Bacteroidaceae bacterium]|nr:OmpA family protein [Bacteroidaceae bacterium]